MENNSPFDSFELQFTPVAQSFFRETAKWAKFLSIIGFIFIGLYVIVALLMIAGGAAMGAASDGMDGGMGMMGALGGTTIGVIYLILALIYFFPVLYLFRFSSKAKLALDNSNTEYLTSSLENLKSHYKFMGIFMIIVLVLLALGIVIGVVAGVSAASATM